MTNPPYRYLDTDGFCLSARLLPDLNTGGVTDTLSITIEGSDEPQSVHVPATDVPAVAAGIVAAVSVSPPATPADTYEQTTGHLITCLAVAGGASDPDCCSPATDIPSHRAGLRDDIAAAIWERQNPGRQYADCEHPWQADAEADADAVLAVLYQEWPWLRAEAEDATLDDTDLTETDIDQMMAGGVPVQIVTEPPPTWTPGRVWISRDDAQRFLARFEAAPKSVTAPDDPGRRARYAEAIHDAMEPDLSLVDQEPGTQALFSRAAEAAVTMADTELAEARARVAELERQQTGQRAAVLREAADHAEDVALKRHQQHEIEREQGALDVMTVLRRLADEAAVTPPPALTEEGRLRAQIQVLTQDAERDRGLAKVGARCMREGHQGRIEHGRGVIEGWRFALSTALDLGAEAPWEAIHERVKELRRLADETATTPAEHTPQQPS